MKHDIPNNDTQIRSFKPYTFSIECQLSRFDDRSSLNSLNIMLKQKSLSQ